MVAPGARLAARTRTPRTGLISAAVQFTPSWVYSSVPVFVRALPGTKLRPWEIWSLSRSVRITSRLSPCPVLLVVTVTVVSVPGRTRAGVKDFCTPSTGGGPTRTRLTLLLSGFCPPAQLAIRFT